MNIADVKIPDPTRIPLEELLHRTDKIALWLSRITLRHEEFGLKYLGQIKRQEPSGWMCNIPIDPHGKCKMVDLSKNPWVVHIREGGRWIAAGPSAYEALRDAMIYLETTECKCECHKTSGCSCFVKGMR